MTDKYGEQFKSCALKHPLHNLREANTAALDWTHAETQDKQLLDDVASLLRSNMNEKKRYFLLCVRINTERILRVNTHRD